MDYVPFTETISLLPDKYDFHKDKAVSWMPKICCTLWGDVSRSVDSKSVDKSRSVKTEMFLYPNERSLAALTRTAQVLG